MNIDVSHLIETPSKKILVVCSHREGRDFTNPLNDSLKLLFGDDPEYTFCGGFSDKNHCTFPENIDNDNKYDAIWFAGCNMSHWIFNKPHLSIDKINRVLNHNGFITFTETKGYVANYKGENNLTLPLHTLGLKSLEIEPNKIKLIDQINELFETNFEPIVIDNHLLFKIKMQMGEKIRKHKRSRNFKKAKKRKSKRKRTIKK
jgi:hypothetical protein